MKQQRPRLAVNVKLRSVNINLRWGLPCSEKQKKGDLSTGKVFAQAEKESLLGEVLVENYRCILRTPSPLLNSNSQSHMSNR